MTIDISRSTTTSAPTTTSSIPQLEPKKPRPGSTAGGERGRVRRLERSLRQHRQAVRHARSASSNMARDKEFQMFWANCEVIKPSIYAKPPQPVVMPKIQGSPARSTRPPANRRALRDVAFDLAGIDELMKLVRDDRRADRPRRRLVPLRERPRTATTTTRRSAIDFKNRRDFLHSISRNWREVTWVAAASYLTRSEARKRFRKHSGRRVPERRVQGRPGRARRSAAPTTASAPSSGRSGTRATSA